jgi:hypothetical protein
VKPFRAANSNCRDLISFGFLRENLNFMLGKFRVGMGEKS